MPEYYYPPDLRVEGVLPLPIFFLIFLALNLLIGLVIYYGVAGILSWLLPIKEVQ
jgi:hypothetical protein